MQRKVESSSNAAPVDAHERARDYLSEEEFAVLLQGTRQSRHRWRNAAMLMLTFYHGLRVTELCRLKRQDVDLTHGRLWVQRLSGDPFTRSSINYLVAVTGVRAGLAFHVHPHMLRHGCGYALANRGYDLRVIQDYLGHRDPKHTTRYTRTAANRFEGLWE
jgi:site-specific recombinase XerD